MADLVSDGKVRVVFLAACANVSAPTVAELNAAVDITTFITPDGLGLSGDTAAVDTSHLASTYDTKEVGRRGDECELTCKRKTPSSLDVAYNTLTYRTAGWLGVRRTLDYDAAWAAGQDIEVYPVRCGDPVMMPPAANELQKFKAKVFITDEPDKRAVVAA